MPQTRKLTVIETLQRVNDGGALEDLRVKLEEAACAVNDNRKGASATVSLVVKIKKTGSAQVAITDEVKCTLPKVDKDETILFVHPEGGFTPDNPLQPQLSDADVSR